MSDHGDCHYPEAWSILTNIVVAGEVQDRGLKEPGSSGQISPAPL
ncbi:MAG: hypothetical protein ABIR49_06690 [Nitrosospira sp.]